MTDIRRWLCIALHHAKLDLIGMAGRINKDLCHSFTEIIIKYRCPNYIYILSL